MQDGLFTERTSFSVNCFLNSGQGIDDSLQCCYSMSNWVLVRVVGTMGVAGEDSECNGVSDESNTNGVTLKSWLRSVKVEEGIHSYTWLQL